MGTFDTVHGGTRCGQTKALGKGLGDLVIGDTVRCYPVPMTTEDFDRGIDGHTPLDVDSFCVAMPEGGFLIVRDSILEAWANDPAPALPLFDNFGHPTTVEEAARRDPWVSEHASCGTCAKVRLHGPAAVAAERAAAKRAHREWLDARRAEREQRRAAGATVHQLRTGQDS